MLAVFTADSVAKGKGADEAAKSTLLKWKRKADVADVRQQETQLLQRRLSGLRKSMDGELEAKLKDCNLDEGVNGISYMETPRSKFSTNTKSTLSCYFTGDLTQKHINSISIDRHLRDEDDCHKIMSCYTNATTVQAFTKVFAGDFSCTTLMRDALKTVTGPYSFVLYDKVQHRIIAARDPNGSEPLFWAVSDDGQSLLFSTDKLALFENADKVVEFPRNAVYISRPRELAGTINGRTYKEAKDMMGGKVNHRRDSATEVITKSSSGKDLGKIESSFVDAPSVLDGDKPVCPDNLKAKGRRASPFEMRGMRSSVELLN